MEASVKQYHIPTTGRLLVEVCCGCAEAALDAFRKDARRIELCDDLSCGGITPSRKDILRCISASNSAVVHVLVRPRAGNFVYNEEEIAKMLSDIEFCASAGAGGVVIGALTPDGRVDMDASSRMISLAHSLGLSATFHRAIDSSRDQLEALEDIITLGADRVLTSGGAPSAPEGLPVIIKMLQLSQGRITIMPGAGITPSNAPAVISALRSSLPPGAPIEIHGSRIGLLDIQAM